MEIYVKLGHVRTSDDRKPLKTFTTKNGKGNFIVTSGGGDFFYVSPHNRTHEKECARPAAGRVAGCALVSSFYCACSPGKKHPSMTKRSERTIERRDVSVVL